MKNHENLLLIIVLILSTCIGLMACNLKSSPPVAATSTTGPPQIQPGEPPSPESEMRDTSYHITAADNGAKEGDLYNANLFERSFTTAMLYLPDVDIQKVAVTSDDSFFYFIITLSGVHTQSSDLQGLYAVELDTDVDGRGDFFIAALNPQGTTWVTSDVMVRSDNNNDVGGPDPVKSDAPYAGTGYETTIANDQTEAAWVRISPSNPAVVQIAIHSALVGNPPIFLWGITADNGIKDPGKYDYDDTYTREQAGSPYVEEPTLYPLKIVNSFDNVCRQPYGFTPAVRIANMCYTAPKETGPGLPPCSSYGRANCPLDRCKFLASAALCVDK
jgi:hypothetical protein